MLGPRSCCFASLAPGRWRVGVPPLPRLQGRLNCTFPKYGPSGGRRCLGTKKGRCQVTWGTPTYSHHVLTQEAFDLPGSVVDGECSPVLHVAGGFRGVIEAVNLCQGDVGSGLSDGGLAGGGRGRCPGRMVPVVEDLGAGVGWPCGWRLENVFHPSRTMLFLGPPSGAQICENFVSNEAFLMQGCGKDSGPSEH